MDWGVVRKLEDWPYLAEIDKQKSDRAAAIIAAAFVQTMLLEAIGSRLRNDKTTSKKLFNPGKPIGDFGAQIELGFMLSLYDSDTRDDLLRIARIRNFFAHKLDLIDFGSRLIKPECVAIKNKQPNWIVGEEPTEPRAIFVSCAKTMIDLLIRSRTSENHGPKDSSYGPIITFKEG